MSILLRDTKGTPTNPDDDDYAYYVGPNVPLFADGWMHFDFAIPSDSTDAVPEGWRGGWSGDPENFRPGVDWNDVITNVDSVEFWWINPSFFAIIAQWEVGVDNISITTEPASVPGDVDGDGLVTFDDLLLVLSTWGPCADCPADLDGNGFVDFNDLLEVLSNWS
jgi:hypothetical protein